MLYELAENDGSIGEVRLVEDTNCRYVLDIDDEYDGDFDKTLTLTRMGDGNIMMVYEHNNSTVYPHSLWGTKPDGTTAKWPVYRGPHAYTFILESPDGNYCGCDETEEQTTSTPDGVESWWGYNLGGGRYEGSAELDGLIFSAGSAATPSGGSDTNPSDVQTGTADDPLWQGLYLSDSGDLRLSIPVEESGNYRVTFYVNYPDLNNKNKQDIALEGQAKISGWEIGNRIEAADYGTDEPRPLTKTANVEVTDGTLDVAVTATSGWYSQFNDTMLSAVKIEKLE